MSLEDQYALEVALQKEMDIKEEIKMLRARIASQRASQYIAVLSGGYSDRFKHASKLQTSIAHHHNEPLAVNEFDSHPSVSATAAHHYVAALSQCIHGDIGHKSPENSS
jgi:hypothetical protein